jgi:hypothetical protein
MLHDSISHLNCLIYVMYFVSKCANVVTVVSDLEVNQLLPVLYISNFVRCSRVEVGWIWTC